MEPSAMIKKKELFAAVATRTGLRKRDVRAVTEALLDEMRQHLEAGVDVQAPPLGKFKVITQKAGTEREKRVFRLSLSKANVPDAAEDQATE